MKAKKGFGILWEILLTFLVIPFVPSAIAFAAMLFGLPEAASIGVIPVLSAGFFFLLRKKRDLRLDSIIYTAALAVIALSLLIAMAIAGGSINSVPVSNAAITLVGVFPVWLIFTLTDSLDGAFAAALITYFVLLWLTVFLRKKKGAVHALGTTVGLAACLAGCVFLYANRPEVRYGGHGFKYMNGYSSTDFTDYTVYAKNSKLVTLDHAASLLIEEAENMPVMDGAEACYPVYAAVAKAVYKDIDAIETQALSVDSGALRFTNGKIVTFTNTIYAFQRLVDPYYAEEGTKIDLFFGARPSKDQMAGAEYYGVDLTVTAIGREAFVFFVEADNPVDDLSSEQIRAIYHGDITNWKEVGGKDQEIVAFQRPNNSGSQTMMQYFMGDITLKEPKTYEYVSSMEGVITQVAQYANEAGAFGYSFRYFVEGLQQEKNVKIISVDGVAPTIENIKNGSYPLSTALCVVYRTGDENENVQKVVDFLLSEEGQAIIEQTGYAGLN